MFYPVDLLSHRRKGKLAPCWLAAMTSEKSFKRYYKSRAIKKIDVIESCKEILDVVQLRRSARFSLYLSSQLMYGITKIHLYQIALYQKEAFEIQQKLDSATLLKKKEDKFDIVEDIELPEIELPLSNQNFVNAQLQTNLHMLSEDPNDGLQMAMQDATCLNFGCLNDEELDFMLNHDNIFDLMRELQISREKDISEKMADITIQEEIQEKQLSQEMPRPVLVDVSKRDKSKERSSLTPQKRQPHEMQVKTPAKKRRLSFETAAITIPPVVEDMAVPALELSVEKTRMLDPSQRMEPDIELESLHESYFMIDRHSKKGKIIDRKIVLSDKQLRKWRQNINIHCKQLDRPLTYHSMLTPAKKLFNQPSHSSVRWNTNLRSLFVNRITEPFVNVNEDVASAELVQFPEMRVEETISRLNLPTKDLSTVGKMDTAIAAEPVDSIVNILPITNIIHETEDISVVPLSEMIPDTLTFQEEGTIKHKSDQQRTNYTDESFEDIEILLERQQHFSKTEHIPVPSTTSIRSSPPTLTGQEILALLEVLWCDKEIVKFDELISPDTYTAEDATTAFEILLEYHAQKKLVLQQIDCSRTLRILKYKD